MRTKRNPPTRCMVASQREEIKSLEEKLALLKSLGRSTEDFAAGNAVLKLLVEANTKMSAPEDRVKYLDHVRQFLKHLKDSPLSPAQEIFRILPPVLLWDPLKLGSTSVAGGTSMKDLLGGFTGLNIRAGGNLKGSGSAKI